MNGHQTILSMRRAGYVPAAIFVEDGDSPVARDEAANWSSGPNPWLGEHVAHVVIAADDVPETLDLRYLVGMRVHLRCLRDGRRARRIFDAIVAARAELVACVQGEDVWHYKRQEEATHG